MKRINQVTLCISFIYLCLFLARPASGFNYNIYGADNCYLTRSTVAYQNDLLRCPLSLGDLSTSKRFRIRLYTLPYQLASQCHLAGSNNISTTAYRFSKFKKLDNIESQSGGSVYEAQLSSEGLFVSQSEGVTWKMNYEIQCPIKDNNFLRAYSVMKTKDRDPDIESWVMN